MATLLRRIQTYLKLNSDNITNPKDGYIYDTPGGIQVGGRALMTGTRNSDGSLTLSGASAGAVGKASLLGGSQAAINWQLSNTRQIRAAVAGARASDFRSRLVVIGDSSVAGTKAARNGLINARRKSWPSQVEDIARAAGYNVAENWWMGDGGNSTLANITAYDPRVVFGSDVAYSAAYPGPGRGAARPSVGPTNGRVTLTPRQPFNTVDVLSLTGASGVGTYIVRNQADAGTGSFNTQVGNGSNHSSFTVPDGSTAAYVAAQGAANVYIDGFGTRDSNKPGMELINIGVSGIDLTFFNTNPATGNNFAHWRAAAPKLMTTDTKNIVVITAGANDMIALARSISQVLDGLRTQLTFLKGLTVVPDVIFMTYPNLSLSVFSQFNDLMDQMIAVCVSEFDICVIDQRHTMEQSATLVSMGLQDGDGLHNYAAGQAITAKTFWECMTQVIPA